MLPFLLTRAFQGPVKRAVSPDMFLTSISGYLNTRPNSSFIMQGIYVLSYIVVTGSVVSARKISRLYRDSNLTIEIEFQLRCAYSCDHHSYFIRTKDERVCMKLIYIRKHSNTYIPPRTRTPLSPPIESGAHRLPICPLAPCSPTPTDCNRDSKKKTPSLTIHTSKKELPFP